MKQTIVMGWIYVITCSVNGKQYIGETTARLLCERWKTHMFNGRLHEKIKENPELKDEIKIRTGRSHLYNAMAKYGVDKFTIQPLLQVEEDDINVLVKKLGDLEIEYIKKYDTVNKGYNIESGGRNAVHTNETKMLISENTKKSLSSDECVKKLRVHHDKLEGLPAKCGYGMSNKLYCYRLRRHPYIKDKCFYVIKYGSDEACKQALLDYIKANTK
jgi:group I intron endonuclease